MVSNPPRFAPLFTRRLVLCLAAFVLTAFTAKAVPPAYDHVVIVIEENENFDRIIGNPSAPYINSLAANGVNFTRMRALVHPSQANYLEFYSGDNQNVIGDGTIFNKFTSPNLGASLIAAGKTFAAYCQSLPSTGDVTTDISGYYVKRHCPWTAWMPTTSALGPNQISRMLHKPFTSFPTDFTTLPTVSFVIPDNLNNMHDGTIGGGDAWLKNNLSAYAEWAKTHNSLLIVTWDEDGFQPANRIPTIFYGANLVTWPNDGSWTLHNLLHTIEDMYGLVHSGRSAQTGPIVGAFAGENAVVTRTFSAEAGVEDTMISSASPDSSFGSATMLNAKSSNPPANQALIKFSNILGPASGQVPAGENIVSAKLVLTTAFDAGSNSYAEVELHRMLVPWSASSTFTSLSDGVQLDGVEAVVAPEFATVPSYLNTAAIFDTTQSLLLFQGGADNNGWVISNPSSDDWAFRASENALYAPVLEVTYVAESVGFDSPAFVVAPNGTEARLTLHRFGIAAAPATVNYSTVDGTATAPSDYAEASGTLTWAAGDLTPRTIVIPIVSDDIIEGAETFKVSLTNPVGTDLSTDTETVTINEKPFDLWRWRYFGPQANDPVAAPSGNPDSDNRSTWEEYVFARNPTVSDPEVPESSVSLSYGRMALQFRVNPLATDLKYTVQVSDDLVTWKEGGTVIGGVSTANSSLISYSTLQTFPDYVLWTFWTSSSLTITPRQFMRVQVSQQ